MEKEGIPIFVIDKDSCPAIAEKVGVGNPGETVVFSEGEEAGRLQPSEDLDQDLKKVRELTE